LAGAEVRGNRIFGSNIGRPSGAASTVGGGDGNDAAGNTSTVGGGFGNAASGTSSTVSGGSGNIASGTNSTVGGGIGNTASDSQTTIGGGNDNLATGTSSTVGGDWSNDATGLYATVSGGDSNTAVGNLSFVGGGSFNTSSGTYSSVSGGSHALASHYGESALSAGIFSSDGDAQASAYILRGSTTTAAATELFLNATSARLALAEDRALTFDILVIAESSAGTAAGYQMRGAVRNWGGTTSFIGIPLVTSVEDIPAWNAVVEVDDVNDALVILVTGAAGTTIRWVAAVRTVEVNW
jgi:hypothetical protein